MSSFPSFFSSLLTAFSTFLSSQLWIVALCCFGAVLAIIKKFI